MRVKVLQLMQKSEEQEVLIISMEKEVNDIVELIARKNCLHRDTQSEVVEVEPLAMDCTYLFAKKQATLFVLGDVSFFFLFFLLRIRTSL